MNAPAPRFFAFDNTYVRDLEEFYVLWKPTPASKPSLIRLNEELARELGARAGIDMLTVSEHDILDGVARSIIAQTYERANFCE